MHAPCENKSYDVKDSFCEKIGCVLNQFRRHYTKIFSGDFNVKGGREDISKLTIRNESSHEINNDNGVRVVNFATLQNFAVKSTMFPHLNIHKYTSTSPEGKMHRFITFR
jgi:hypothetical protein